MNHVKPDRRVEDTRKPTGSPKAARGQLQRKALEENKRQRVLLTTAIRQTADAALQADPTGPS